MKRENSVQKGPLPLHDAQLSSATSIFVGIERTPLWNRRQQTIKIAIVRTAAFDGMLLYTTIYADLLRFMLLKV